MEEDTSIYRVSGSAVNGPDGFHQIDFASYEEAASLFRVQTLNNSEWCDLWEITGNSAMHLCKWKSTR